MMLKLAREIEGTKGAGARGLGSANYKGSTGKCNKQVSRRTIDKV